MTSDKTRVLVVDDHDVVIEGVKARIAEQPEFEICGFAKDGLKAVELAESLRPDIMIMDISMPKMNGVKAAREIRRTCGDIRIVIFSMHSAPEYVTALIQTGIFAYVLKSGPTGDLITALRAVRNGERYFCAPIQEVLNHPTF
jgi:DNA-binding NarL/FixJ family response regulator